MLRKGGCLRRSSLSTECLLCSRLKALESVLPMHANSTAKVKDPARDMEARATRDRGEDGLTALALELLLVLLGITYNVTLGIEPIEHTVEGIGIVLGLHDSLKASSHPCRLPSQLLFLDLLQVAQFF